MICDFSELSNQSPFELHYNPDNLLENIIEYDNFTVIDLFDTLASVCYCDFYNKRNEDNYNKLTVNIGVTNPEKFNKIKEDLENLISFMTNGEIWEINFYGKQKEKLNPSIGQIGFKKNIDSIALLSGGLDALAGASQELNNNTLFVTFGTNQTESGKAKKSFDLIRKSNPKCYHVTIPKIQFNKSKHSTQRTRSLIFLGSALIYADFYAVEEIKIYENGIMSLNPNFLFRRRVTHTTHPRTIYIFNTILRKLGLKIKVINPFSFMTKAEVIELIPQEWNSIIKSTKTCSKMQGSLPFSGQQKSGICHCGVCAACILRQISILNSSKVKFDCNYSVPYNISSKSNIEKQDIQLKITEVKRNKILEYKYIEKNP